MRKLPASGIVGETVTTSEALTVVRWTWARGARSEQLTLPWQRLIAVQSGRFALITPAGRRLLVAPVTAVIPAGSPHQLLCLEHGVTLDEVRGPEAAVI